MRHFLLVLTITGATLAAAQTPQPNPPRVPCSEPVPVQVVEPIVSPLVYAGGTVVARVLVSPAGTVNALDVIKPVAALVEPVTTALTGWRFTPARCDGDPVEAWTTVAVHVVLVRDAFSGGRTLEVRD